MWHVGYVAARPQHDGIDEDDDSVAGTSWSFIRRSRRTPRSYGSAAATAGQSEASEQPDEAAGPSTDEPSLNVHVSNARRHRDQRVFTSQMQADVEDV